MCDVEKEITCQMTFSPIVSSDYKNDVNDVIKIIDQSGLAYEVGRMSTEIRGEPDKIFRLVEEVFKTMENRCGFTMDVRYSNLCGI